MAWDCARYSFTRASKSGTGPMRTPGFVPTSSVTVHPPTGVLLLSRILTVFLIPPNKQCSTKKEVDLRETTVIFRGMTPQSAPQTFPSNPMLTQRQREVLFLIKSHTEYYGYPPTQTSLAMRFGLKTQSGIQVHLTALEKKGYIKRLRGPGNHSFPRAICILKLPAPCPADEEIKWN